MQGRRARLHLEDNQHQVRRKCQISIKRLRKLHNIEAFKEADTLGYLRRIAAKPHRLCLNGMMAFNSRRQRHHKT